MSMQQEILDYCATKPEAEENYSPEWEAFRYRIREKMFLMLGEDNKGKPIVTVKLKPEKGDFLRQQYPDVIVPGYYMNKVHWNSVYLETFTERPLLWEIIDESYELIVGGFLKKHRQKLGIKRKRINPLGSFSFFLN